MYFQIGKYTIKYSDHTDVRLVLSDDDGIVLWDYVHITLAALPSNQRPMSVSWNKL